jgi:cytochrome c
MSKSLSTALVAVILSASAPAGATLALAQKFACIGCHAIDKKLVGPSFQDVSKKYAGQAGADAQLVAVIKKGGAGKWGSIPMPAQPAVTDADAKALADWVLSGAK